MNESEMTCTMLTQRALVFLVSHSLVRRLMLALQME